MGILPPFIEDNVTDALIQWSKWRRPIVYPDDTFLVSYPRSGNTWMRFLITNLIYPGEPTTFLNLERRMPDIHVHPDIHLRRFTRPRFLKSHKCFDPRYKRIIYVVRDPRDVAVSFYHHSIRNRWIPENYPISSFVARWMEAEWHPEYGTWAEHVRIWLEMRSGRPGFFLLRYRELHSNPREVLAKIAGFLGIERSNEQILRAIELSDADHMRTLEKKQQRRWVETRRCRLDKPFVRKATVGNWRTELPRESIELIESAWGPLIRKLGFPL